MRSLITRVGRGTRKAGLVVLALGVLGAGIGVLESTFTAAKGGAANTGGWGGEALAPVSESGGGFSIIGIANACGLGASSCFKCHNGSRAEAPNEDPAAAPWHAEHRTVNNSCAGCHNGNPRIIRKEMAHRKLIADPRSQPAESCADCHANDTDEMTARYTSVMGGGN